MSLSCGPLSTHTVHLCIDMQNVFAEPTSWHTQWMARVLPAIEEIAHDLPPQRLLLNLADATHPRSPIGRQATEYSQCPTLRWRETDSNLYGAFGVK